MHRFHYAHTIPLKIVNGQKKTATILVTGGVRGKIFYVVTVTVFLWPVHSLHSFHYASQRDIGENFSQEKSFLYARKDLNFQHSEPKSETLSYWATGTWYFNPLYENGFDIKNKIRAVSVMESLFLSADSPKRLSLSHFQWLRDSLLGLSAKQRWSALLRWQGWQGWKPFFFRWVEEKKKRKRAPIVATIVFLD